MLKLNMWYLLGIVLTVLWLIVAPLTFAVRENDKWDGMLSAWREICLSSVKAGPVEKFAEGHKRCWDQWQEDLKRERGPILQNALWGSAALAALGWVLVVVIVYTIRWVLAGRRVGKIQNDRL